MKRWFAGLAPCTAQHAVLLAIAITLPSGASLAQGTRAQRMACAGDVWRLCSSAIPSVDRIVACLKRERARLSPGCQAVINDAEAQAANNRPPAATPGKANPHAQPEQAANTPAAPAQDAAGPAAVQQPKIVARSLPDGPPEEVAPAAPPALSGAGRAMAAPTERLASRDVDSMTPVSSRHSRQQREAYHQSSHRGRSGNRYGGIMEEIAPLIAMAMGGGQGGGGFDVKPMMGGYGGRGNFDVTQIMGMARSMGFDPGTFMAGGGY